MSDMPPALRRTRLARLIGPDAAATIDDIYSAVMAYRMVLGWLFGAGTLICALLSALDFRWTPVAAGQPFIFPLSGFEWAGLGLILSLIAFWLLQVNVGLDVGKIARKDILPQAVRIRWPFVGLVLFFQWVLGRVNSSVSNNAAPLADYLQLLLLIADIVLLVWAFGSLSFSGVRSAIRALPTRVRQIPLVIWLLLGITLIGFIARIWQLDTLIRFPIDNATSYTVAGQLRNNINAPIFNPLRYTGDNFAILWPYLGQLISYIFGPGTSGLLGFRMLDVIMSTLAIPAMYWLAAQLTDDVPTGLIAAVLLAVLPPYLHASRITIPNMADTLFGTLMLAFLVKGLRRNSQSAYVWAGISLAFCNYFYEGGRYVFDIIAGGTLLMLLLSGRLWRHRRGVIVFLASFALIALPFYMGMTSDPQVSIAPRLISETVRFKEFRALVETLPLLDLIGKFWNDALQYVVLRILYLPSGDVFYATLDTPVLLWYILPFFWLGLYTILWRLRIGRWLILAWLFVPLIGIAFLSELDALARYVIVFPVLALIAAIGVRMAVTLVGRLLIPLRFGWRSRVLIAASAVLTITLAIAQINYFFNIFVSYYNTVVYPHIDPYDALMRARSFSPTTIIYVSGQDLYPPVLDMAEIYIPLSFSYQSYRPENFTDAQIATLPKTGTIVFAIFPGDTATLSVITAHYAVSGPYMSPYSIPPQSQYALYVAVQKGTTATPGSTATALPAAGTP